MARRIATLASPDTFYESHGVTLSAGPRPTVCALWSAQHTRQIWCYSFGDTTGRLVYAADTSHNDISAIALRPDGQAIAWTENPHLDIDVYPDNGEDEDVVTADYSSAGLSNVVHGATFRQHGLAAAGCRSYPITGIAWSGTTHALLSCHTTDGEQGVLLRQALPMTRPAAVVTTRHTRPYGRFGDVVYAGESDAYAIETADCSGGCTGELPVERAVRFDLRTGRVLEVIAHPALGRELVDVSGGADGVTYVTSGVKRSVYVRFAGEKHGTQVSGLPSDAYVTAQP